MLHHCTFFNYLIKVILLIVIIIIIRRKLTPKIILLHRLGLAEILQNM